MYTLSYYTLEEGKIVHYKSWTKKSIDEMPFYWQTDSLNPMRLIIKSHDLVEIEIKFCNLNS